MEAIYDDMPVPTGMMTFAPVKPARGPMFGARTRAGRAAGDGGGAGSAAQAPPGVGESDLYRDA